MYEKKIGKVRSRWGEVKAGIVVYIEQGVPTARAYYEIENVGRILFTPWVHVHDGKGIGVLTIRTYENGREKVRKALQLITDNKKVEKAMKGWSIDVREDTEVAKMLYEEVQKVKKEFYRYCEEQFEKELQEKLKKKELTVRIGIGGDTHRIYIVLEGFSEFAERSQKYRDLENRIEKAIQRVIMKAKSEWYKMLNVQKTDIKTGLYNILHEDGTWGRIDFFNEYLQEALKELKEEEKRKKEERKRKKEELERKRKKALEEAKRTGKEIVIRYIGWYDGDDEEQVYMYGTKEIIKEFERGCPEFGVIAVYEVATPDGKIVEKHIPNY